MTHLPGLVVVIDARREQIAVAEASKLGIPIIGVVDTNADPDPIDFPIAANDDAIKSIRVIIRELIDAAVEASGGVGEEMLRAAEQEKKPEPPPSTEAGESQQDKTT